VRERYLVSGHIHPGVSLTGAARQHLRLPCFVIGTTRAILPAFGQFTGNGRFPAQAGDRVFVVAGKSVMEASV
jgi:metallophosphoesterase superfamily enzyme